MSSPKVRDKFLRRLFGEPVLCERFVSALEEPPDRAVSVLWREPRPEPMPFPVLPPAFWQPGFVDRVPADARPGATGLHERGAYYCLDLSSVFAASAVLEYRGEREPRILDLCAAPGGKAVFAATALHPEELVANEPIRKRCGALISNLQRCGVRGSSVVSHDPATIAEIAPSAFDLVIVDAPCSGQSLLFRGTAVPGCFHERTIDQCAKRQRRIIANAAQCVAPGGSLAYMTCTFSREENEEVVSWLLKQFPQFHAVSVPGLEAHRSLFTDLPCYRLWPWEGWGAGAFTALLKNTAAGGRESFEESSLKSRWRFPAFS